jgi:hypothetical protein
MLSTTFRCEPVLKSLSADFAGDLLGNSLAFNAFPSLLGISIDYEISSERCCNIMAPATYWFSGSGSNVACKVWSQVEGTTAARLQLADVTFSIQAHHEMQDLLKELRRQCSSEFDLSHFTVFYLPHCAIIQTYYLADHVSKHWDAISASLDDRYVLPLCTVVIPKPASQHAAVRLISDLEEDLARLRSIDGLEYFADRAGTSVTIGDVSSNSLSTYLRSLS